MRSLWASTQLAGKRGFAGFLITGAFSGRILVPGLRGWTGVGRSILAGLACGEVLGLGALGAPVPALEVGFVVLSDSLVFTVALASDFFPFLWGGGVTGFGAGFTAVGEAFGETFAGVVVRAEALSLSTVFGAALEAALGAVLRGVLEEAFEAFVILTIFLEETVTVVVFVLAAVLLEERAGAVFEIEALAFGAGDLMSLAFCDLLGAGLGAAALLPLGAGFVGLDLAIVAVLEDAAQIWEKEARLLPVKPGPCKGN